MVEEWADVKDFEGLYEVSTHGRVRSLDRDSPGVYGSIKRLKGRVLKQPRDTYGYKRVSLFNNGQRRIAKVHRLVAECFISKAESQLQVNHRDLDKSNNRVDNLEWVTCGQNTTHARDHGRYHAATNPKVPVKLSEGQVSAIRAAFAAGMLQTRIAEAAGTSVQHVNRIVHNLRRTNPCREVFR